MVMNPGYDRKNINSGASAKDGIYAKSPRCDKGAHRSLIDTPFVTPWGKKQVWPLHI